MAPLAFGFFFFALALQILAMRALVGLDVHETAFGVADGIDLLARYAAMGGASAFGCHDLLLSGLMGDGHTLRASRHHYEPYLHNGLNLKKKNAMSSVQWESAGD